MRDFYPLFSLRLPLRFRRQTYFLLCGLGPECSIVRVYTNTASSCLSPLMRTSSFMLSLSPSCFALLFLVLIVLFAAMLCFSISPSCRKRLQRALYHTHHPGIPFSFRSPDHASGRRSLSWLPTASPTISIRHGIQLAVYQFFPAHVGS